MAYNELEGGPVRARSAPQDFAEKIEGNNLFGVSGSGKRMTTSPACRQGVVRRWLLLRFG